MNIGLQRHTSAGEAHTLLWKRMMKLLPLWRSWVREEHDVMKCLMKLSVLFLLSHITNTASVLCEEFWPGRRRTKRGWNTPVRIKAVEGLQWVQSLVISGSHIPQVYNWSSSILQLIRFFFFSLMPPSRKWFQIFTVITSRSLLIISINFFMDRLLASQPK